MFVVNKEFEKSNLMKQKTLNPRRSHPATLYVYVTRLPGSLPLDNVGATENDHARDEAYEADRCCDIQERHVFTNESRTLISRP
jgi:hypothetical protein